PTVAKTIAKAMLICPWLEVKPARGRTISLGMGGKMVSRKTMIPDADRPQCFHDGHRPCGEAAEMLRCSVAGGQHEIGPGTGQRSCRHGQKCRYGRGWPLTVRSQPLVWKRTPPGGKRRHLRVDIEGANTWHQPKYWPRATRSRRSATTPATGLAVPVSCATSPASVRGWTIRAPRRSPTS